MTGSEKKKGKKREGIEPHKSGTVYPAGEKEIHVQKIYDDHAGVYTESVVSPESDYIQDDKQ